MPMQRLILLLCIASLLGPVYGQQNRKLTRKERQLQEELSLDPDPKKRKKSENQVLETPKDPPSAVSVDSQRLVFHVSPLSGKGLLSQQTRDALKSLVSSARGASIQKVRAFVAGTGDLRRVQAVVSEEFTDKRQPLPALSVIQVGALPLDGAQVVLESVAVERKKVADGVVFVTAQPATAADAVSPLKKALDLASLDGSQVRRVTCFLNSLAELEKVRSQTSAAFPEAAANFVQLRRDSVGDFVACEAVATMPKAPDMPVRLIGSPAQVTVVGAAKLVMSGTQMAFGREPADLRLAFDRIDKALDDTGADLKQVVFAHVYSLANSVIEKVANLRPEYFDSKAQPATTALLFEGLPSLDASMALDVIAIAR
jgi:enamine deaminase RidA (YjgF/YER057c/UK114 family)